MPLCLVLVQYLQLAAKERKNGKRNDVDDDDAGATATTDVMIAGVVIGMTMAYITISLVTMMTLRRRQRR
jgi:hypothetical protein